MPHYRMNLHRTGGILLCDEMLESSIFQYMENLAFAFQLLIVGMLTVFVILLVVIYGSKLLITIVNQIAPEGESVRKTKMAVNNSAAILTPEPTVPTVAAIDAPTMELLQQAVAQLTGGKGRITEAVKL